MAFLRTGGGGSLRHALDILAVRHFGLGFPFGTLAINITGSLVMGLRVGLFAVKGDPGQMRRLFLTTGVLGSFTTFLTFSLDTVYLYERREVDAAALNRLAPVAVSIIGLFLGMLAEGTMA